MTIIVTGAAGFIGSNIVHALNRRGITDIIAVDNLSRADKFRNLVQADMRTIWTNTNSSAKCAPTKSTAATSKPSSTKAPAPTP